MNTATLWIVERRRLDEVGPHSWSMTACAIDREEAEHHYRRHLVYLQCHEMRLVDPAGEVMLYTRDPSYFSYGRAAPSHRTGAQRLGLGKLDSESRRQLSER